MEGGACIGHHLLWTNYNSNTELYNMTIQLLGEKK